MRRDLYTISDNGMNVQDVGAFKDRSSRYLVADWRFIESLLASKDVKGFPIVSADAPRKLVGFINRADIRYLLGMSYSPRVLSSWCWSFHKSGRGVQRISIEAPPVYLLHLMQKQVWSLGHSWELGRRCTTASWIRPCRNKEFCSRHGLIR